MVARYDYGSANAFSRDLQDFLDAHVWAFRMLITMQRELHCDSNPGVPFSQLPRLLRFRLHRLTTRSDAHKHRNPATRFALVSHAFEDLDAYARKSSFVWEQSAVMRDEAHRTYTLRCPLTSASSSQLSSRSPAPMLAP